MRSGHSFDFGIGCAHEIWRGAGILMISRIPTVGTDEQTSSLRLLVSGGNKGLSGQVLRRASVEVFIRAILLLGVRFN